MQRINNDIKNGNYQPVYLLYGEERYLKKQYKDKLKKALCATDDNMNNHFFEGKGISVGEVIDLAETMPFFADRKVIFLENSGFLKSGGEQLAEYLGSQNETTVLIFVETEIDKRCKLFKAIQTHGCVIEFTQQDENTLKRWIAGMLAKEGKKITENTVQLFLSKTGTDMENIYAELEKVICYCMDRDVVTAEDVETICTTRITSHIFDMVDAIADKKRSRALELYYELLALKEPPMRILFLIARQCNILLQVKSMKNKGFGNKEIASTIGVPPFAVGKYATQAAKFKTTVLRKAVTNCVEAEEAVKTGRMNDVMSVEILIMGVFGEE
ncbi:MAG: DNA polymerase III subunit delta [Lachnospiraceae bacterium]|nr:DNA polymerase III subunit delta [Lachnospiraceae bacterium]